MFGFRQKKENNEDSFILDHCTKRDLKNMNDLF